jgi:aminopeptidase
MALEPGALQAVQNCLKVTKDDQMVIVTDEHSMDIASALLAATKKCTKHVTIFILEDFGERPLKAFPQEIGKALEKATVSIFAGESREGEIESVRRVMLSLVSKHGIRHAHMVGITTEIMEQGMAADYKEIQTFSAKVYEALRHAAQIRVMTDAGTDIMAEFSSKIPWIISDGNVRKEKWSNLPDGEVWSCVTNCHGTYVIDGVLGDHFSQKYGLLDQTPLTLHLKDGRIKYAACANEALLADFERYTSIDENANRVGEFALGTNLALKALIGNLLQDEKFPGVHIAFGHCYPQRTGVAWDSRVHCDAVIRNPTVIVDGRKIMESGRYLI